MGLFDNNGRPGECYRLRIDATLADSGDHLTGGCGIRVEGTPGVTPLEDMDEDLATAVVVLLVRTALMSLARREPCRSALMCALASLGLVAVPEEADVVSFDSEGKTLPDNLENQTTQQGT